MIHLLSGSSRTEDSHNHVRAHFYMLTGNILFRLDKAGTQAWRSGCGRVLKTEGASSESSMLRYALLLIARISFEQ